MLVWKLGRGTAPQKKKRKRKVDRTAQEKQLSIIHYHPAQNNTEIHHKLNEQKVKQISLGRS